MTKISTILSLFFVLFLTSNGNSQTFYPGGDTCATSVTIGVGEDYFTAMDGPGSDHWYDFVAPCDGDLVLNNVDTMAFERRLYSGECESLVLLAESTWSSPDLTYPLSAGDSVFIVVDDSWSSHAQFDIVFLGCDVLDSTLLDFSGTVYYDLNENGIKDVGEYGAALKPIISDPFGLFTVTNSEGDYYSSTSSVPDGVYEIYPNLEDIWNISTDSLVYTLIIDSTYEPRDSLDFGIYPEILIYDLNSNLSGGLPRCNDTIDYWLSFQNIGTTIGEGLIDLELDDSLNYISSDLVPDSIVGQHLYWNYEELLFSEYRFFSVQVATPDGVEDTVSSSFTITIDSAGVEMFASTQVFEQVISCACDPNDKTPTPLGEGVLGYIPPTTESIEYLIRFQNTGTDTAINVVIKDQLDANLDWYSLTPLAFSHDMNLEMDIDGEVSFIFNNIMLPDTNVNYAESQGFVKYRIDLLPGLPLETSIYNTADIYFDFNPAVITNTTINTLHEEDSGLGYLKESQDLLIFPNPSSDISRIYFSSDLTGKTIQIIDMTGKLVYSNSELSGKEAEIQTNQFNQGMYILLVIDTASSETIAKTKLVVK